MSRGAACPVCDSADAEVIGSVLGWEGKTVRTFKCQDCGETWQRSD